MISDAALTVVVAVEESSENITAILEALDPPIHPTVEFVFGFAGAGDSLPSFASKWPNVDTLTVPTGQRIPHIWAEGIRQSSAKYVGLLTGHFIPRKDWVAQALALPWPEDRAAYGGVISNSDRAGPMDWGIFILRYCRYAPPKLATIVTDIAADNSVYRRDLVLDEASLLANGFWEPAFHARFIQRGFDLALDPALAVEQHNRYSARDFASQRYQHAIEFGRERAETKSTPWILMMLLLAPLLPGVFFVKVLVAAVGSKHCRRHFLASMPWVVFFLACWGSGEARGYFEALRRKR
jgi:hypothetical protein